MKTFYFITFCFFVLLRLPAQDLAAPGMQLNELLVHKELYQTQVTFPGNPYNLRLIVPNHYFKQFDIRNVNVEVKRGYKQEYTGNLYEVSIRCKQANNPCILVDIGEKSYMDIYAVLLFEQESDARKSLNLLDIMSKRLLEW